LEFGRGGSAVEESGEERGGWLGGREGEEEETSEEEWFVSSFIGVHCFVEERERESSHRAGLRSAGGTGVPFGCVAVTRHRRPDVAGRREDS
jgi:hypothetical protein